MNDEVISELSEGDTETTRVGEIESAAGRAGGFSPTTHSRWAIRLSDRAPSEVRWLWPGRIPLGKITLLIGDPGLGKSLVTLDLAARVTRGAAMPAALHEPPASAANPVSGSVVLLSAEDDIDDTIVPRLFAAGADMDRIHIPDEARLRSASHGRNRHGPLNLKNELETFEEVVADVPGCRLVIVDPISAFCGHIDVHRNADVRALLAPLAALAAGRGFAVLAVNHLNKSMKGPLIYRSMGSLAFAAAARNVLAVVGDPKSAAGRICLSVKSNLHAPPPGLRFTIEQKPMRVDEGALEADSCGSDLREQSVSETPPTNFLPNVVWQTEAVDYAAEIAAANEERAPVSSGLVEACEWLDRVLAGGSMASNEIKRLATEAGISHRTLWRAKDRLGVAASCPAQSGPGAVYVWQLPAAEGTGS
jgi:putative DNA primase/helicase